MKNIDLFMVYLHYFFISYKSYTMSQYYEKSTWGKMSTVPTDIVYKLTEQFNNDEHPKKVILCAGAYRSEIGDPYVLPSVRVAEELIVDDNMNNEYTNLLGSTEYRSLVLDLIFGTNGDSIEHNNVAFAQTIAGTGALRVAAELYKKQGITNVYLSNPTWRNHRNIFGGQGFTIGEYRYVKNNKLDLVGMIDDIKNAPENSLFVYHACAHNPTGIDLTDEEWKIIEIVIRDKGHQVLFDMAYQGFGSGDLDRDAYAVRYFAKMGNQISVTQTFSKNMGLYGQRIGSLCVVTSDKAEVSAVESQLKVIIRPMYSTPSLHGARIAIHVMGDESLCAKWKKDLKIMVNRISNMRKLLKEKLTALGCKLNVEQITEQRGMFFMSGMTEVQVKELLDRFHIYIIPSGRISIVGLTHNNIDYVANAISIVTANIE